MSRDLISRKTRNEFREFFVGWTLRTIEMEFDAAYIPLAEDYEPPTSGERRSLVEQYYHSLDFTSPSDTRKLLKLYGNVLTQLDVSREQDKEGAQDSFSKLTTWLREDGYVFEDGRLRRIGETARATQVKSIAHERGADYLARQVERMENAVEADPWLAIGTAKELVETTCKTVLEEEGVAVDKNWDLMELWKRTRKELKLAPDDIPDSAKAAATIKRLLSNLTTVVQGLAELRNPYGTGHGASGKAKGLRSRHARLAVGSAATLAEFIFETHRDHSKG